MLTTQFHLDLEDFKKILKVLLEIEMIAITRLTNCDDGDERVSVVFLSELILICKQA